MTRTILLPAGRESIQNCLWKTSSNNTVSLNLKLCIQGTLALGNYCNNIKKGFLWENPYCTHKHIYYYMTSETFTASDTNE